jgi:lysophospholipase L1-like esterase
MKTFLRLGLIASTFALSTVVSAKGDGIQATRQLLENGGPIRIVCFGDSVTGVYYHTGSRRAWCDVLGLTLERLYPRARIEMINAGVSGNTTGQGLARMETDVVLRHPQLVVAMFGLNDVARGKGPEEFRDHVRQIVSRSRAAGAEVILMTPNSVYPNDAARPPLKVAEYAEVVRQVGRAMNVPVADCYQAYETIHAIDRRAWYELMSETIHPNMRGHKLFAEEVAWTISGRHLWLDALPPLKPAFPRVLSRLRAKQPLRVIAMKPYDGLIGPALRSLYPGADVRVTSWTPDPHDLEAIADQAKTFGWLKFRGHSGLEQPDLVVLAVPARALAATPEEFYRSYSWIVNWSLPLGQGGWDILAVLPSVAQPQLDPAEQTAERSAREVMLGQDVPWLERSAGDDASPGALLARRLAE